MFPMARWSAGATSRSMPTTTPSRRGGRWKRRFRRGSRPIACNIGIDPEPIQQIGVDPARPWDRRIEQAGDADPSGARIFRRNGYQHVYVGRSSRNSNPSQSAVEPVSVSAASSRRETVPQGQRPGRDFGATTAYSTRQRLGSPTSPSPKPREVKDNENPQAIIAILPPVSLEEVLGRKRVRGLPSRTAPRGSNAPQGGTIEARNCADRVIRPRRFFGAAATDRRRHD